jgi:hypothetical protein
MQLALFCFALLLLVPVLSLVVQSVQSWNALESLMF